MGDDVDRSERLLGQGEAGTAAPAEEGETRPV
jgi:hypothetical protein